MGSKSGGSQTQKTSNEPWKELQPYLKEGYERGSNLYAEGQGPQYYPGQTYAPNDPLTNESRAMQEYYARNQMGSDIGAIRGAYGQMLGPNELTNNKLLQDNKLMDNPLMYGNKLLGALDFNNNPFFTQGVNAAIRPFTEQLTEQMLPSIRSGAVQTGQYGGSRQALAEGTAIGKASRAIGDTAAQFANNAY